MKNPLAIATSPLLLVLLAGCSLEAPQQAPEMGLPKNFKESGIWKIAKPAAHVPHGDWWSSFHDSELTSLLRRVEVSNASLAAAAARARESSALLIGAKLAFLPTLSGTSSATRSSSQSGSGSSNNSNSNSSGSGGSGSSNRYAIGATTSWEIDLWGRLRHNARAITADAESAAATVESTRLSLQAQAAQTYFSLRAVDAQQALYNRQLESYEKSFTITKNRYAQGVASRGDVAQAESQLASTRSASIDLGVQRSTYEHALAVLIGHAPSSFSIPRGNLTASVPGTPSSTPSRLLERRPDIASAERTVAAANERIGAAKAAFYPTISLGGSGGWEGPGKLLSAPTFFWSLGPDLAAPILDGGQRLAAKAQADATYDATVADYRQTVLTALQEVEDNLSTLRILAHEAEAQEISVRTARESERIALNAYKAGTDNYLNVSVTQAAALAAERNSLDLQARRLNASVALMTALGGKW
jgi:NodT family efflux transporter outer membrane factor (OMF) lipoprotein